MVRVLDEQRLLKIPKRKIAAMARAVMAHAGVGGLELSVVLTDDAGIRELNRTWLGRDRPTNVLSLSQREGGDEPGFRNKLLGDVVVSVETCARHAAEAKIEPLEEVVFCLIHGIAHLLGYDHEGERAADAPAMEKTELDLFRRFGPLVFGPAR